MSTNRPKAYSYLRFSTPEQMKGNSLKRQSDLATDYAERHGLDLDTKLTFKDLGVSAFRGANFVEGALSKFIEAVDSGRVEKGSYLLVENLDRLSREKARRALRRFEDLIEKGITVVTLQDGKVWTEDGLDDPFAFMMSFFSMVRAHEESEVKARRLKAAWQNKRERAVKEGHKLTAKAPGWLKLKKGSAKANATFELIPARVAIVQRIFAEALEGHGQWKICSNLNQEKVPTFGKSNGWHHPYIKKILSNPAVIGRFQPMKETYKDGKLVRVDDGPAIEGYFPAIVSVKDFDSVQRTRPAATGKKGRPLANVFSGLTYCAGCGGKMHWVNKGEPPKGNPYLACDNARRRHTCSAKSVRYAPVSKAILGSMNPSVLSSLPFPPKEQRTRELMARREAVTVQKAVTETAIANLVETIERLGGSPAIDEQLVALERRLKLQTAVLEGNAKLLREAEGENNAVEDVQAALGKFKRKKDAIEAPVRLNSALKRLIDRVAVGPKEIAITFKGVEKPLVVALPAPK